MHSPASSKSHEQGSLIAEALTLLVGLCVIASLAPFYLRLLAQAHWGLFVTLAGALIASILTFTLLLMLALLIGHLISWLLLKRKRHRPEAAFKINPAEIPATVLLLTIWISWMVVMISVLIDALKDHPRATLLRCRHYITLVLRLHPPPSPSSTAIDRLAHAKRFRFTHALMIPPKFIAL